MSSASDITVNVTCDASDLTRGMTQARQELDHTTTSITQQDATWKKMAVTGIGATGSVAGGALKLVAAQKSLTAATVTQGAAAAAATPPTLTLAGAMNLLFAPITLIVGAVALVAAAFWLLSGSEDEAAATTRKTGDAAEDTAAKMGALARIKEAFGIGAFGEEVQQSLIRLGDASSDLMSSFAGLSESITKPFVDAGFEVGSLLEMVTGLNARIQLVSATIRGLGGAVDYVTEATTSAIHATEVWGTMLAKGVGRQEAEEILAIRDAHQAAAIAAKRAGDAHRFAQDELASLMADAKKSADQHADAQRIGSITTIEGINAEVVALEKRIAKQKESGHYGKSEQENAKATAAAIANRKLEIPGLTTKETSGERTIQSLSQSLNELTVGQEKAAASAKLLTAANSDEYNEIERLIGANQQLKDAQAEVAAANNVWAGQKAAFAAANDSISRMTDEIAIMTGAATKADIAMKNAMNAGATQSQAEEIGALTQQLEDLQKKPEKAATEAKKTKQDNKAIFAGSSAAAEIMLRGVGGPGMEKDAQKTRQQMLTELKAVTLAVKANKRADFEVAKV